MIFDPNLARFEEVAKEGGMVGATYALAYATLRLAEEQRETALALDRLGFNMHGAGDHAIGTTEKIAMELAALNETVLALSDKP